MSSVSRTAIISILRNNMSSMLDDMKFLNTLPTRQGEPWFGISALKESVQLLDQLRDELDRNDLRR